MRVHKINHIVTYVMIKIFNDLCNRKKNIYIDSSNSLPTLNINIIILWERYSK